MPNKHPLYFSKIKEWMGHELIDNYVAIVFECPDRTSARAIIQKNKVN